MTYYQFAFEFLNGLPTLYGDKLYTSLKQAKEQAEYLKPFLCSDNPCRIAIFMLTTFQTTYGPEEVIRRREVI